MLNSYNTPGSFQPSKTQMILSLWKSFPYSVIPHLWTLWDKRNIDVIFNAFLVCSLWKNVQSWYFYILIYTLFAETHANFSSNFFYKFLCVIFAFNLEKLFTGWNGKQEICINCCKSGFLLVFDTSANYLSKVSFNGKNCVFMWYGENRKKAYCMCLISCSLYITL